MPLPTRPLTYDAWANREALASLRRLAEPPAPAVRWMAHVAAAQLLWWERIEGRAQSHPVWPEWTLAETAVRLAEAEGRWAGLLSALAAAEGDPLARAVHYVNSKGEPFTSTVGDIITHVTHHGAYHRGQIAAAVRAAGGEPALTDFIHAARTGVVE